MGHDEKRPVDEKATMKAVKQKLAFLSANVWLLRQDSSMVEDSGSLMDFIAYTRSVITVTGDPYHAGSTSPVIEAMQRRDQMRDYQKQKQQELLHHMIELMKAIELLPLAEKRCITMKYVMQLTYQQMAQKLDVSFSSVGRILRRAYLHLAQLLSLEVYKDFDSADFS